MNIVKATKKYEAWLGKHTRIVPPDLARKHVEMAKKPFPFLRATFYRWLQVWPEVCPGLNRAPRVLGVGDLHVENFGTWRDIDGRLVWGINDFDEACQYPYTMDLVRLATSALVAARGAHLAMRPQDAVSAILRGYVKSLQVGGRPFVLAEEHDWLRRIAESKLRDPVQFWRKMDRLPTVKGNVPKSARKVLESLLPEPGLKYRLVRRVSGLGSLGRMRFVALAAWRGGRLAREAKAAAPPVTHWLEGDCPHEEIFYSTVLARAVRCPDPYVQNRGDWIVRRLSPHCSRIELDSLGAARGEIRLLKAMGWETANVHLGSRNQRDNILKDLQRRKGNWLESAAEAMARVVDKDWRVWKEAGRR
jgi:hypothetical protein